MDQTRHNDLLGVQPLDRRSLIAGGSAAGIAALTLPRAAAAASPGVGGNSYVEGQTYAVEGRIIVAEEGGTHTTIQAAHDALPESGGVIEVMPGTYSERLLITKSNVSIIGPNAGIRGVGTRSAEALVTLGDTALASPYGFAMIAVTGSDVTFDGLQIEVSSTAVPTGFYPDRRNGKARRFKLLNCRVIGPRVVSDFENWWNNTVPDPTTYAVNMAPNTTTIGGTLPLADANAEANHVIGGCYFAGWRETLRVTQIHLLDVDENVFYRNRSNTPLNAYGTVRFRGNRYEEVKANCMSIGGNSSSDITVPANLTIEDNEFINNYWGLNLGTTLLSAWTNHASGSPSYSIRLNRFISRGTNPGFPSANGDPGPFVLGAVGTVLNENWWGSAAGPTMNPNGMARVNVAGAPGDDLAVATWCTTSACGAFTSSS